MAFQFLAYLLCCLLKSVCDPTAEVSVLERFLGRIIVRNRYAPGSRSSLSVNVRMATMTTIRYSVVQLLVAYISARVKNSVANRYNNMSTGLKI